jgi:hypothetical protein
VLRAGDGGHLINSWGWHAMVLASMGEGEKAHSANSVVGFHARHVSALVVNVEVSQGGPRWRVIITGLWWCFPLPFQLVWLGWGSKLH